MTTASGLRLVSAGRKSRKGDESSQFDRQEARNAERAERDGHVIIHTTRDVVSSQTMPWDRKNLKAWMTDPAKMAMYDGILVETDRLARCDDKGWHTIESWCYDHDKKIITTEGVQFPARDDSDRYQWIGLKRRARTYWEDVKAKHAQTRELIKANGGAIGLQPFGYKIEGPKLHKQFVIDRVTGPWVVEAFKRIADGRTITSVALWLTEVTGKAWRVKRVSDMIKRPSYLGSRDGHVYEALISVELWEAANSALAARSQSHGGRRAVHGYSSVIYCACGASFYRHQSVAKGGSPVGAEKYRCSRGRRSLLGEARCEYPAIPFDAANKVVDAMMRDDIRDEWVMATTGGDSGRQMELQRIKTEMTAAMGRGDMSLVTTLAAKFAEVDSQPAEPIRTVPRKTGRTMAEAWSSGSLSDQRAMLGDYRVTVLYVGGVLVAPAPRGR